LEDAIFATIKKSSTHISPDIHSAFEEAIKTEKSEASRRTFEATLRNLDLPKMKKNLACPDTVREMYEMTLGNSRQRCWEILSQGKER